MKQYLSFFKLKFTVGLQYRAAALAGLCTQLFFGFVFILIYTAFYKSGVANPSMSLKELTTYLWLNQTFYALIYIYHKDNEIINMIKKGDIAYEGNIIDQELKISGKAVTDSSSWTLQKKQ